MLRAEFVVISLLVRILRMFLGLYRIIATRILDLVRPDYLNMLHIESLVVSLLVGVIRLFLEGGGAVATRIPDLGWNTFLGSVRLPVAVSGALARHPMESDECSRAYVFGNGGSR